MLRNFYLMAVQILKAGTVETSLFKVFTHKILGEYFRGYFKD